MTENVQLQIVRPELLDDLTLQKGAHGPGTRHCFLEALSILTGQQMTDTPFGVEYTIRRIMMGWNDLFIGTDAQRAMAMKPLFVHVMNTSFNDPRCAYWESRAVAQFVRQGPSPVNDGCTSTECMTSLVTQLCALAKQDVKDGVMPTVAEHPKYGDYITKLTAGTFTAWDAAPPTKADVWKLAKMTVTKNISWSAANVMEEWATKQVAKYITLPETGETFKALGGTIQEQQKALDELNDVTPGELWAMIEGKSLSQSLSVAGVAEKKSW